MNKALLVCAATLLLAGCQSQEEEQADWNAYLKSIPDLADCKMFILGGDSVKVIRCPNSSTTVQYTVQRAKHTDTYQSTVIDQ